MKKMTLVIGGLIGFLLGSRAGRGPYERVESWAHQVSGRPQVQRVTNQVSESGRRLGDAATDTASTAADRAADATAGAVSTAADHVTKTIEDVGERIES